MLDSKDLRDHFKIVTIVFKGIISSKSEKLLDSSDFAITYDINKRVMNI